LDAICWLNTWRQRRGRRRWAKHAALRGYHLHRIVAAREGAEYVRAVTGAQLQAVDEAHDFWIWGL
jgi:hypothetical protein